MHELHLQTAALETPQMRKILLQRHAFRHAQPILDAPHVLDRQPLVKAHQRQLRKPRPRKPRPEKHVLRSESIPATAASHTPRRGKNPRKTRQVKRKQLTHQNALPGTAKRSHGHFRPCQKGLMDGLQQLTIETIQVQPARKPPRHGVIPAYPGKTLAEIKFRPCHNAVTTDQLTKGPPLRRASKPIVILLDAHPGGSRLPPPRRSIARRSDRRSPMPA